MHARTHACTCSFFYVRLRRRDGGAKMGSSKTSDGSGESDLEKEGTVHASCPASARRTLLFRAGEGDPSASVQESPLISNSVSAGSGVGGSSCESKSPANVSFDRGPGAKNASISL